MELVNEGKIGKIKEIYSHRLNTGKVRQFENVWWSFAPHDVLLILNTVKDNVVSLGCSTSDYLDRKIADSTITTMKFSQGCFAHIYVSWFHPFKLQSFVVVGTDGAIEFTDSKDSDKLKLYGNHLQVKDKEVIISKDDPISLEYGKEEPLTEECIDFINCIKTRGTPKSSIEDGIRVVDILTKAMNAV
jgi:UDP-2-acetamido-3-amino-2,3-dideoxy-glucuronate N-acetyltransferase